MSYYKNTSGQYLYFTMINASDGSAITSGTVSGYRSIDGGTQTAVTGTITHKGNGQWELALSQADTNGDEIGCLFTHASGIPVSITIVTDTLKNADLTIPTAVQIRQEIDSNSTKLDTAVSTRSSHGDPDPSGFLDVAVSSRLAAASYTTPPTAAATADAVWDEATADHQAAGSTGLALTSIPGANPGAIEVTDILVDDGTNPVEGAELWITTDAAGNNTVWAGVTNASGYPKDVNDGNPWLDAGTYYLWVQKVTYSFTNPTSKTVS